MVEHSEPSGTKRPRGRRWRRWLAGIALVVALLAVLAFVLRDRWIEPLARRWLVDEARARLGAELTLARISPGPRGWHAGVVVEGLRWRASEGPLRAVEEARVELGWSLSGALDGAPRLRIALEGRGIELVLPQSQRTGEGGQGGTALDLERLELDLRDVRVHTGAGEVVELAHLEARGSLTALRARIEALALASGPNRLTLTDAALDLGAGDALAIARSLRGELSAELPDARVLASLLGRSLPLHSATLALTATDGRASLAGMAELEGGTVRIERGEVRWPAGAPLSELELALGLQADLRELAPLAALVGRPIAGRWRGSIEVAGPLRAPSGRFVGHGEGLVLDGLTLGALEVDVTTDGERARFERCEISGPELEAVLRGELGLEPLELRGVALNVSADRGFLAEVLPVPCAHAFLHARLDGPLRSPHGAFELSADDVELGRVHLDEAEARGTLEDGRLEVAELRLASGESAAEAAGSLVRSGDGWSAELASLALAWRDVRVAAEPGARLALGPGRLDVDGLVLTSAAGGADGRASVALRMADGRTRAALVFDDYQAGPLLSAVLPEGGSAGRLRGRIEGELGADTSGVQPTLALDLALDGWRLGPAWPALDAVLRGAYDGRELALERLELGYEAAADSEGARLAGTLRVPLALAAPQVFGAGPVELELEGTSGDAVRTLARAGLVSGASRTGATRIALGLTGEWRALAGRVTLAAESIVVGLESDAHACDLEAELVLGERLEIERARLSAPSGAITVSGALATPCDLPRWLTDRWVLLEAPLALDTRLDLADVGWIAGHSRDLRRIAGQVAGRIGIGGSVLAPVLTGRLEWREGELRLASDSAPLRNLTADLVFEGGLVRIERLAAEVGGAPVQVTGTVAPFGPFPRLDLALSGKNMLIARDAHLRLRADAELVIKGTPGQLAIRGEVALAEGLYLGEISPLEELVRAGRRTRVEPGPPFALARTGPLASAEFDVHLGGKDTFRYKTNLLVAEMRPDAWLRGTGEFPVLEGNVYVEEASFELPSGKLELTSGILTFKREAPLLPEIALTAAMRVQRHDVRITATGSWPPEVMPSSSPPLAQDDLWVLILTGQLPQDRSQDRSSQAMEALAVFLARDSLVRWFGSDPDDAASLLDRFELEVGAETSNSGKMTGRVLFYLRPQTRRSQRATYISAELDRYDRVNYAFGIVFRPR
jgi:translocation-and-assembly-module (TAM) inner membrane subunit TamB-like protein